MAYTDKFFCLAALAAIHSGSFISTESKAQAFTVDSGFNQAGFFDGQLTPPGGMFGENGTRIKAVFNSIENEDDVIVGGSCYDGQTTNFCLAKFTAEGTLDQSFGSNGVSSTFPVGLANFGGQLTRFGTGYLLSGRCVGSSQVNLLCAIYTDQNGIPIPSFDASAAAPNVTSPSSNYDIARLATIGDDIYLATSCNIGGTVGACVAKRSITGALVPSYGVAGVARFSFSTGFSLSGLASQADGKIVVMGGCTAVTNQYSADTGACLARLNNDGTLDSSFGDGGSGKKEISNTTETMWSDVAIDGTGGIILGGTIIPGAGMTPINSFHLLKLTQTGQVNTSFGTQGRLTWKPASSEVAVSGATLSAIQISDDQSQLHVVGRCFVDTVYPAIAAYGAPCYSRLWNSGVLVQSAQLNIEASYAGHTCSSNDGAGAPHMHAVTASADGNRVILAGYGLPGSFQGPNLCLVKIRSKVLFETSPPRRPRVIGKPRK